MAIFGRADTESGQPGERPALAGVLFHDPDDGGSNVITVRHSVPRSMLYRPAGRQLDHIRGSTVKKLRSAAACARSVPFSQLFPNTLYGLRGTQTIDDLFVHDAIEEFLELDTIA